MMEENKRVLLGMSGGTDSSVAAMRLLEAGYEVTGVTFRFYELNDSTEYLASSNRMAATELSVPPLIPNNTRLFSSIMLQN
jgi:tRNA-specific 2-thiouridylase